MTPFIYRYSVLLLCALCIGYAHADWHSETQGIMGTEVSVTLWHSDTQKAQAAIAAVMTEMHRIDAALSPYIPSSELSSVNNSAYAESQILSDELTVLIDKSLYFGGISNGAFDITFASLAQFYNYREKKQPNQRQFEEALPAVDNKWLQFDKQAKTLRYKHEKVKIDLGGIAKGYAVDQGVGILQAHGIEHASVSAGGDSRVLGDHRGRPWVIGIKNPRLSETDEYQAVIRIPLENAALSTSGDYERFFIDERSGERVHHIINPQTGKSAADVMSVTIIGDHGLDTDPLSTTVFVLGVNKGLKLVNKLTQFDAIIIDINGKVHYSDGLAEGVE